MSLLFPEKRAIDIQAWGRGEDVGGYGTLSGETVNFSTVVGLDAVAAVIGLFSDVVYMLPLDAYRTVNGVKTPAASDPSIIAAPSLTVDAGTWRAQMVVSWLLWGNAYGMVMSRNKLQLPETIEWLCPDQVTVEQTSSLKPATYSVDGSKVAPGDLVHIPGRYLKPGQAAAMVPLERFKETFGLAAAARNFGARWFGEGAHPSAILYTDKPVTPEAALTIKERVVKAWRGKREPAILGLGMKYQQIQNNPNESQFAETQQNATVAVARALGLLQPEMIGAAATGGNSVTYANREQRAIDFLTFSADPYLVRIERACTGWLPNREYARFNRDALLRSDTLTRYQAHDLAIRGGFRSPNRALAIEDEPPVPNGKGDEFLWPPYATKYPDTNLAPAADQGAGKP
jgi:HK97 family phage portal protein